MAKMHKTTSQYYTTPIREFYLDIARFQKIEPSPNDQLMTITPEFENRPDLLANRIYGTPSLWWVFALRNMDVLIDPVEDMRAGVDIWIPSPETVNRGS